MDPTKSEIAAALDSISEQIGSAQGYFDEHVWQDNPYARESAEWNLERAFTGLLVLAEALHLPTLRDEIAQVFSSAKEEDLLASETGPDDEQYLVWAGRASIYTRAISDTFAIEGSQTITRDLESILRAATHSVGDVPAFGGPPQNEAELHARLEAILKCIFPDLMHKPALAKSIKNFEPDSGIPSLRTLLEYKFLRAANHVSRVADEILADTRGYHSKDWGFFVYVIYETGRFRAEATWRQHLRDCGIDDNTRVILLSGEPRPHSARPGQRRSRKRA